MLGIGNRVVNKVDRCFCLWNLYLESRCVLNMKCILINYVIIMVISDIKVINLGVIRVNIRRIR